MMTMLEVSWWCCDLQRRWHECRHWAGIGCSPVASSSASVLVVPFSLVVPSVLVESFAIAWSFANRLAFSPVVPGRCWVLISPCIPLILWSGLPWSWIPCRAGSRLPFAFAFPFHWRPWSSCPSGVEGAAVCSRFDFFIRPWSIFHQASLLDCVLVDFGFSLVLSVHCARLGNSGLTFVSASGRCFLLAF